MLNRLLQSICLLTIGLLVLVSCAGQSAADQLTTTPALTETAAPGGNTPVVPLATPTPSGPMVLTIWIPEPLSPLNNRDAATDIAQQITAFEASEPDILVETRLKKVRDIGGIMETLRTASAVAPGALPDLVLVRREDLLTAVQSGLIQPLDERTYTAHLADFYPGVLELGKVNGQLYGLPYALDVSHLAYVGNSTGGNSDLQWQFSDILENNQPFVFAAGRTSGLNDVFLIQYLAAGGVAMDGTIGSLNANALRSTLTFYEQAVAAELLTPSLLDYTVSTDFSDGLSNGTIPAAVINASQYLVLRETLPNLQVAPVPTASEGFTTLVDGWMWVMVTSNADQQTASARFINWMLDAERQGHFTEIVHLIPSQRDAVLRRWEATPYAEFVNNLMDRAAIPLAGGGGVAARAMQTAFAAVLQGQRTADEATQDALAQVGG
ncbi:MAG: extracellular solute-binding protein [Anaerolineaceae bacterium]|nr:extracellular solute-binding protein [Anaerolineaceae bacterium]